MLTIVSGHALLISLAVFAGVALLTWQLLEALATKKSQAELRLDQLQQKLARGAGAGQEGGLNRVSAAVSTWLDKARPQLAKPLQSKDPQQVNQLQSRLAHAGFRSDKASTIFLALKFVGVLAGLLLVGATSVLTAGSTSALLLRTSVIVGGLFFLPDLVLRYLTARRQRAIFLSLPDAVDLMVVCVEAGLGLDQAMRRIAAEMKKHYPIIAYEFGLANLQLQMGLPRTQVLRDLGQRNGEEDLRGLVAVLIQSSKFGSGVGQALRIHSHAMRTRRRQRAEEHAAKTAVKLVFPLVLFIFPAIFVVLVGPAAISIARSLLPSLGF